MDLQESLSLLEVFANTDEPDGIRKNLQKIEDHLESLTGHFAIIALSPHHPAVGDYKTIEKYYDQPRPREPQSIRFTFVVENSSGGRSNSKIRVMIMGLITEFLLEWNYQKFEIDIEEVEHRKQGTTEITVESSVWFGG